ncbi:MAG: hypothetical protein ACODAD_12840 [Planctomycetota bacterium]
MKRSVVMSTLACLVLFAWSTSAQAAGLEKDAVGPWQLTFTTPEGEQETPVVVVGWQHGQYLAWHVNGDDVQPFNSVKLQGDTLVGTIAPRQEPGVMLKVKSRLAGQNECQGVINYKSDQEAGSLSFTGQRIGRSAFDETQTWKLDFVAPNYKKYTPTVTVVSKGDNVYAWVSDESHELPASKVTVDGDRVEMRLTAESAEGDDVDLIFNGIVEGDTVKGKVQYDAPTDTGSFPFSGKRTS